ncbi:odorant receptor 56a-like [Hermetia illucens]|uniref:odorant receptor 56a-like n=1 Tax=Hermetia illucens TaxID=343691 RepID=UPI0018CC49B4|nr:odorant receptor 56a-like [Hermetia illucens]
MGILNDFALDSEVFDNPLIKWQLHALKYMGFIYSRTDCWQLFHLLRGVLVSFSLFVLVCAQARSIWLQSDDLAKLSPALGASIVYINISARIIPFYYYGKIFNELLTKAHMGVKKVLTTNLPTETHIFNSYRRYITTIDYIITPPFAMSLIFVSFEGLYFIMYQLEDWSLQEQAGNATIPLAHLFDLYPTRTLSDSFFFSFIVPFYMASIGITCFFAWPTFHAALMRYISFRLDVINYKLENMSEYADNLIERLKPTQKSQLAQHRPKFLNHIFITCVKDIAEVKLFTSKYEYVSNVAVFIESSTISALLCVQLYLISMDFSAAFGIYGVWIFATAGILWLYYWHANEISHKSNQITNALYSFNWYEVPLSLQKDVAIFMGASMKPIIMKSGFIHMNTNSFVTILKTSYSYFTLLGNVAE